MSESHTAPLAMQQHNLHTHVATQNDNFFENMMNLLQKGISLTLSWREMHLIHSLFSDFL
jgi:hypothetical protein